MNIIYINSQSNYLPPIMCEIMYVYFTVYQVSHWWLFQIFFCYKMYFSIVHIYKWNLYLCLDYANMMLLLLIVFLYGKQVRQKNLESWDNMYMHIIRYKTAIYTIWVYIYIIYMTYVRETSRENEKERKTFFLQIPKLTNFIKQYNN